ncbi:MAG: T9SS type A sorting domain-containing protein [Bacteroidia bacterium]
MKLKLILFQLAFLLGFALQAQKINWVETFGGKGFEQGRNIILDQAGNSIILGAFTDTCYFSPNNFLVTNGGYDIFISKQNQNGGLIWTYSFGDNGFNKAESITSDDYGNIYVVGNFTGTIDFNPGIGYDTLSSWIQSTGFVLKISSTGNFVWVNKIGGFLSDTFNVVGAIAESNLVKYDQNGSIIIGGRFEGNIDFDFSLTKDSIFLGMGNYILKLDTSGSFKWVRIMKNIDTDKTFTALQANKNGEIIAAGLFTGEIDFDLGPDTFLMSAPNSLFANFVLKLDSTGEFKWVKSISQNGYLTINDIHTEITGKIILCGNFADSVGFNPANQIKNHYSSNQANSFLCIWTENGNYIQSYSLNSNRNNFAQTIHSDNDENIYLSGFALGKFWVNTIYQTDTFLPKQNSDIYLLKFESNGQIQWGNLLPGNGNMNQSNFIHNTAFNKSLNQLYYTGFFIDSNNFVLQKSGIQQSKGFSDIFLTNLQLCNSSLSYVKHDDVYKIKDTAYFTCFDKLSGSNYQWQEKINGVFSNIQNDSSISGTNTTTLTIKDLKLLDNGRIFRCNVLADSCLSRSKNYTLNVVTCLKLIDSMIYKLSTNIDEPLKLVVKTKEPEKNQYEWQVLKLGKFVRIPDSIGVAGIDNDTLLINQSKLTNNQNYYRCIVNQEECSEKSDSILHITNCSGLIGQTDSIKYYKTGDTILLTVQSKIAEQYSWEMRILGSFIAISELSTRFKGMKNDTLLILNADANFDNTEFRCLLINGPCQAYIGVTTTKLKIENSLKENNSEKVYELYPNPTTGIIRIEGQIPYSERYYQIFDITGKLVTSGISNSDSSINLSHISKGMYFLELNDLKIKPIKFIKE